MFFYAELNENNICKAVSELAGEVIKDTMIRIDSFDMSLLGKKYDNGEWEALVEPTPEPHQPSNAEVAQMISDLQVDLIIAGVI